MTESPKFGFALRQTAGSVQSSSSSAAAMNANQLSSRSDAFQHLDRIVVVLEADAVAVVAGGGDLEQQRLAAGAGRGLQHVDHVARAVGVQLVDDRAVDVEAVHGAGVGGQRHEAGGGGGDVQVVDQDADPALERGEEPTMRLASSNTMRAWSRVVAAE